MSDVCFACTGCRSFIAAGARWCEITLEETEVVARGAAVDPDAVLSARGYWDNPEDAPQFAKLLVQVRGFLQRHAGHHLLYAAESDLFDPSGPDCLVWLNEETGVAPERWSPRYCRCVLGLTSWPEVEETLKGLERPPAWWDDPSLRLPARNAFEACGDLE